MPLLIITAILLFLNAQWAFAATTEEILEAFKHDEKVQLEIAKVVSDLGSDESEYEVVSLGGGCGVVGLRDPLIFLIAA